MRRLPALRTLSLKENPYCESDEDWRGFVVALLPSLVFLEYHTIKKEEREEATARHQGDIFRAQNHVQDTIGVIS